ncbi:MAG: DUF167 domain-containing protein [Chitinophagaceae bacterium]|nr:DUF167 domain-containing protein [Chitinophagaceae bacterium]
MKLYIKIKPNSKSTQLLKDAAGNWVLKVKAPPVDGKANEEVIRVLAKILKLPKSAVTLLSGQTNSNKRFEISVLEESKILNLLEDFIFAP